MSDYTTTPVLGLYKPTYDADAEQWGLHLNENADKLDTAFSPSGGIFLPLAGGTMTGQVALAGISTAPTAVAGTNTTQIASTAFVAAAVGTATAGGPFLPLSGGQMTGGLVVTATGGSTSRSVQDRFGEVADIRDFGAVGNVRSVMTAVTTTNGSGTVTVGSALFTAADVGKAVRVGGASGALQEMTGTIQTVTGGGNTITVDTTATVTQSAVQQLVTWGTPDTTAIQNAVASLPANGGTVLFPPGNYMLSATITLPSNIVLRGTGGATITAAGWRVWPGTAITSAFAATSQTNITVRDLVFSFPQGHNNFGLGGGPAHVLFFTSCQRIRVLHCECTGGTDFTSNIGCTAMLVHGNRVYNACNCPIDNWGTFTDLQVTDNLVTTLATETNPGVCGIAFTGINNDNSAATAIGFVCTGNIVYCNTSTATGIIMNGHASGGILGKGVVANNKIIVPTNVACWGILVSGMGQDILIHHNYLEGNSGSYSAIAAVSPAQNIRIENNLAFGWQASTAPNGVFQNAGQYGSLVNNMSFACSSPLLGAVDGSTLRYGNDTGTGTLQAANLTVNGALTGQSTGAFSGLMTANGGISCGSTAASAAGDLSHHLALYGSIYGLSVTGGTLNAVTQGGSFNIYDSAVSATVAAFNTNTITLSYPTQLAANVGFHGASPIARPTVTGAKGSNAALASLLAALSSYGLVTDSTGA